MNICIFGAASDKIDKSYIEAVERLGQELAQSGHSLIFGAGAHGLMGAAARGFHKGKGRVIGVVPRFFRTDCVEDLYEQCDEFIYTETMAERKAKMEELADVFITAPGGIGTYEEFFEVLVLKQLARHNKPIAIYDVNNYYAELEMLLKRAVEEEFLHENCYKLYSLFKTGQEKELVSYIEDDKGGGFAVNEVKYG